MKMQIILYTTNSLFRVRDETSNILTAARVTFREWPERESIAYRRDIFPRESFLGHVHKTLNCKIQVNKRLIGPLFANVFTLHTIK